MELQALLPLSLAWLVQDVLIVIGASVALLASLAFINLGILLPGLLTLGGYHGDPRDRYLEFGPAAGPIISEPAAPRAMNQKTDAEPNHATGPRLGSHLPGSGVSQSPPVLEVSG